LKMWGGRKRAAQKIALILATLTLLSRLAVSSNGQGSQLSTSAPAPVTVAQCPALPPILDPSKKVWKHGDEERKAFVSAISEKDAKHRTVLIQQFASEYPDSDYLDSLMLIKMSAEIELKDPLAQLGTAQRLLASATADPRAKLVAYAAIADLKPAFIQQQADSQVPPELEELSHTVSCGEDALAVTSTMPGTDKMRNDTEASFAKARGYVAYRTGQYDTSRTELRKAIGLKPDGYAAYLFLAAVQLTGNAPDTPGAIFSLARASILAPSVASLDKLLRDTYSSYHGSDKGLDKVLELARSNPGPPSGFSIQPKKTTHPGHVVSESVAVLAAIAVVGLAGYVALKTPSLGTEGASTKVMIFGGRDHKTYLGCLNCSEYASDSVFNAIGPHGSRIGKESIWNSIQPFGSELSPYSACNPLASDPPVIVDANGEYLGRLTLNLQHPQLGIGSRFYQWLSTAVCQ
jgi:hypothetical protein